MRIDAPSFSAMRRTGKAHGVEKPAALPRLPAETFASIVANTPLVSIDLIVHNEAQSVLLGRRSNPPARRWWFVPGGRIFKNETLDAAFSRITLDELGTEIPRKQGSLLGVYEHFYDTDFTGTPGRSTHYIVLAYRLQLNMNRGQLPRLQHDDYRWASLADMRQQPDVHPYTKAYFQTA